MKTFDYLKPKTLDAALREYSPKVTLKAGGIDVLDRLKERIETPDALLSIEHLPDLAYIREDGAGLKIGALATLADLGRNELIKTRYQGLWTSAAHAATPQVRERATVGGNLCQRPRCWYFRNHAFHCKKKGGEHCFAADGENQYHAIFGDAGCHIVHPSNIAPSLLALDAVFVVRSTAGERTIKSTEFFTMPDVDIERENVLKPGDILTEIRIPAAPTHSATIELREKQSFDWPLVMASVARVNGAWRVGMGAVAPVPLRSAEAEAILKSQDLTDDLIRSAASAAVKNAEPMSQNKHKVTLLRVAIERALRLSIGQEVPL